MSTTPKTDTRVKELSLADGYFHIDLLDGLRLTAPLRRAQAAVNAHLSEDPPPLDWDGDIAPQPA